MVSPVRLESLRNSLLTGTIAMLCFDKLSLPLAGRPLILADIPALLLILAVSPQLFSPTHRRAAGWLAIYPAAFLVSDTLSPNPGTGIGAVLTTIYLTALCWATSVVVSTPAGEASFFRGWRLGAWLCLSGIGLGLASYALGWRDPMLNPWLHIQGTLPESIRPRIEGWFKSPNQMCDYLILALGVALWEKRRLQSRAYLPVAIALGSVWTFSSALGAIALVLGWLTTSRLTRITMAILAVLLLVLNTVSYPALRCGRLEPSHRARAWLQCCAQFVQVPLHGTGPGQLHVNVDFSYPDGEPTHIAEPHSVYFSLLGQTGLLGTIAFFWIVYRACAGASQSAPELRVAILASVLYSGLTLSLEDCRHLWLALGAGLNLFRQKQEFRQSDEEQG